MANYKAPRYAVVVDALPVNASGKVLKRELRAHFTKSASNASSPDGDERAGGTVIYERSSAP
jgi:acyl-coenzyme A synthetase/AMP-(fatty) acid ligase